MYARILSIAYDRKLLLNRHQLLEKHGYSVISTAEFGTAMEHCRRDDYDLVLIGHSIPHSHKVTLLETVKRTRHVPVFSVMTSNEPMLHGADKHLDQFTPSEMLSAIEHALKKKNGASA